MTALQNLMVGHNLPGVLLYDYATPAAECEMDDALDMRVSWQNAGYRATYQCVEPTGGAPSYCRRRNTNGPVHLSGFFGAWRPRVGNEDLYTSREVCNLACTGAIPKP
jgi:hypothetical protein